MPRDYIYYRDWTDRDTGWRWRLCITPAHNTALSISSIPAFGLNAYSGKFIPFPANILFRPPDNESAGYNDRPMGAAQLPSMKLSINLANISGEIDTNADGVSDMEDLLQYIVTQKWTNGGVIEGRYFDTSTVFTLFTDRGDSSITDVVLFYPFFSGAQRVRPTTKYTVDWVSRVAKIELELIHIIRIAAENVKPDDLATRVQNRTHPVGPKQAGQTIELLWRQSSPAITFGHLRMGPFDSRQQQVDLWRLVDVWNMLSTCIEDVMAAFMRITTSFQFDGPRGVTISGRRVATPVDVFQLFRQRTGDASGEKGTPLATTDLWVPGRVSYMTTGQAIGGFLRDDATGEGQESLFRWSNMWDYIIAAAGPALMRLQVNSDASFRMIWDGARSTATPMSIPRTVILGDSVEFEQGGATIRGASAEPAEETQDPVEFKGSGLDAEPDATISLVHSNHPDWGQSNEAFAPLVGSSPNFGGDIVFVTTPGYRGFGLYYIDTFGSTEIPVRPHHYCEVFDGTAFRVGDCADAVPPPGGLSISLMGGAPTYPMMQTYLWVQIRAMYHQMIYQASMPYAAAKAATRMFSDPMQTVFDIEVPLAVAWWQDLGRPVSGTSWPNGSTFLWGGLTFLDPIPGSPVIISVQDNPGTATSKLTLLARP